MKDTFRACRELLALCWRQSPGKLAASVILKLAAAASLPLSAVGLGALTDAAVAHDAGRAAAAGAVTAALVIASITLAHFAHVFYFELGEINLLTKERQLIELANGSAGLDHHERPEYADKMQVLRHEVERVGYSSMEALLSAASVSLSLLITGVLLARLDPLLLLLPLTALPAVWLSGRARRCRPRAARPPPSRPAAPNTSSPSPRRPQRRRRSARPASPANCAPATVHNGRSRPGRCGAQRCGPPPCGSSASCCSPRATSPRSWSW